MIILNQNKTGLINTERVMEINILDTSKRNWNGDLEGFFIVADGVPLGKYSEEERAKQILQDLYNHFYYEAGGAIEGDGRDSYHCYFNSPNPVYAMPEE